MDIKSFAAKPKLEKLEIDDPEVVEAYGESITFYMIDQMDISTYFNFYKLQQSEDGSLLNALLRKIILKEDGKPVLDADEVFPVDITLAILVKINDHLGKSKAKTSTPAIGTQQS
jgi:hypothetical protein